jgi:ribosomal protein S18 acetylase RimI-like enzyme
VTVDSNQTKYAYVSEPNEDRSEYVMNALIEFNRSRQSPLWTNFSQTSAPLEIYALDDKGLVVGGLTGKTNEIPEWLNISVVWVKEELRGRGIGRRLMNLAEEEAKRRACRFARLATSDYQAPDFYKKMGYIQYGKLENCPQGEIDYYFYKELT